VIKVYNRS